MSRSIEPNYNQLQLLPLAVEDWVGEDHPARFIREFVDSQDLKELGFKQPAQGEDGRPHYPPHVLLKAWLFGYVNEIRSSRKLERACREQMSLIWLTGRKAPDHNTLWRFWQGNEAAIRNLFVQGVQVARQMGAVSMVLHALDGTRIEASVSTNRMLRKKDLEKWEEELNEYIDEIEEEIREAERKEQGSYRLPPELADKQRLRQGIREALEKLKQEDRQEMHPRDPEARVMKTPQGKKLGYNAQAVVDEQAGIVVGADVVTDQNDAALLIPMLEQVENNLGEVAEETVTDSGYKNQPQLQQAEDRDYPVLIAQHRPEAEGGDPYHGSRFQYDESRDVAVCPRGEILRREGATTKDGVHYKTYRCASHHECPVARHCSRDPKGRKLHVSEYWQVAQKQRKKQKEPESKYKLRRRKAIVERAFAEIKQHMGFRRSSVTGLAKNQTQWLFICLAYNLRRLYPVWREA